MAKQTASRDQYNIIEKFRFGYRNREDITTLPPDVLVSGSQNILTNTFQRIGARKGYTLDGQRSDVQAPIESSFDWTRHTGDVRHLRSGFNTGATDGKLQFRYVADAGDKYDGNTFTQGQVYWIDIMDSLDLSKFSFCDFWDFNDELKSLLLFVNTSSNIFMWSGGVATAASYTANTITKNGTDSWEAGGFLGTGTFTQEVLINGNVYTYTGGADTTTLTGVSPSPVGEPVNSVVVQNVVTFANSAITGLPAAFQNNIIENLNNQIYVAGVADQSVYVSKVNDFQDFSFSSPRAVGEGAILTLDGVPTALSSQQSAMYISCAPSFWYNTLFQLSSDNTLETLTVQRLKTTALQGAQSDTLTTKIKNNIAFVSFEPIVNMFGTAQNYLLDPQMQDFSFSIVNDINTYDFTDGCIIYFQKFVFLSIPKQSIVRIYNQTNEQNQYWEAPQTIPIACFSIIDGELYGHSYQSSNTFKLFVGFNDDGHPILTRASFAFNNNGTRTALKNSISCYVEGYMSSNTVIDLTLQREFNGAASSVTYQINGNDSQVVPQPLDTVSLGKVSLGKNPLGGSLSQSSALPKFRVEKTYSPKDYFEEQIRFESFGIDQEWEIIAFGTNALLSANQPTFIRQ